MEPAEDDTCLPDGCTNINEFVQHRAKIQEAVASTVSTVSFNKIYMVVYILH